MNPYVVILLIWMLKGGFIAAGIFMCFASLGIRRLRAMLVCIALSLTSLLSLVYLWEFSRIAESRENAFMAAPIAISLFVWLIWSLLLFAFGPLARKTKPDPANQ